MVGLASVAGAGATADTSRMTLGGGDLAVVETGVRESHAMEMGLQASAGFCGFCRLSTCSSRLACLNPQQKNRQPAVV